MRLQKNIPGMVFGYSISINLCLLIIFSLYVSPEIVRGTFKTSLEQSSRNSIPAISQEKKEITIRNVTKETVIYTFHEARTSGESGTRRLAKGEIHRYSGDVALDITFLHGDGEMTYRIEPGAANAFRYDEDGKIDLFKGSHGRTDVADLAPFLETPMDVVTKMLEMAELEQGDLLYDIGSGDGRIVIAAAQKYGIRGVGIELDAALIKKSKADTKAAGVDHLVTFHMVDATKASLSEATVVTMYLLTESNELMRPHLERQLKLGTRVLTHNYAIERWEDKLLDCISLKAEDNKEHSIYLYQR